MDCHTYIQNTLANPNSEGYAWAEDKEHCEEYGRMLNADPSKVSPRAKKRGLPQMGTLGAGNHYAGACKRMRMRMRMRGRTVGGLGSGRERARALEHACCHCTCMQTANAITCCFFACVAHTYTTKQRSRSSTRYSTRRSRARWASTAWARWEERKRGGRGGGV